MLESKRVEPELLDLTLALDVICEQIAVEAEVLVADPIVGP